MPLNITLQRLIDGLGAERLMAPYAALKERRWRRQGKPPPAPPSVKRAIIRDCAAKHGLDVLVETGTFLGGTVQAMLPHFRKIYSIELSEALYNRAVKRFSGSDKVVLLQGDSAARLPSVLRSLTEPALFWLDGHYSAGYTAKGSKETPVIEELEAILTSSLDHAILVDDARLFDGTHDYPTVDGVRDLIGRIRNDYSVSVADDIIRVLPRERTR
jgi:hypothetical protein